MLQDLRQLQAKTRQAFLLLNRIEDMEETINTLLIEKDEDMRAYETKLKKSIKGKPNHLQVESQKIIDEIKELRAGKLQRYLKNETKKTTKTKK